MRAAVLGLCGLRSVGGADGGVDGGLFARLASDAPRPSCPTLFVMQWDDELFERDGVLALFEALGPVDKRLHANPGGHAEVPPQMRAITTAFIVEQLTGAGTPQG